MDCSRDDTQMGVGTAGATGSEPLPERKETQLTGDDLVGSPCVDTQKLGTSTRPSGREAFSKHIETRYASSTLLPFLSGGFLIKSEY